MHVNEAWQERGISEIDQLGARADPPIVFRNRLNLVVRDDNDRVLNHAAGARIEKPASPHYYKWTRCLRCSIEGCNQKDGRCENEKPASRATPRRTCLGCAERTLC